MTGLPERVCTVVIGGGITGLCLARSLRASGRSVIVLEAASAPGGLLAPQLVDRQPVDSYYHHIFVSDGRTRRLLADLGLRSMLRWRAASVALLDEYGFHPLTTPIDVLRFEGLKLGDKVRLALLIRRARVARFERLDDVLARDWAIAHAGEDVWDFFLRPLVEAKFGARASSVSAAWLAGRIGCRSSRGLRGERLGYLVPGFHALAVALARELEGQLWCGERATGLAIDEDGVRGVVAGDQTITCHDVVFTGGARALAELLGPDAPRLLPGLDGLSSQGILCGIFAVKPPAKGAYWTNVMVRNAPFNVVVQQDLLHPSAEGVSVIYASRYVESAGLKMPADNVLDLFQKGLESLMGIEPASVVDRVLACTADAGLVYTTGTFSRIRGLKPTVRGLHLAGMLTSFPDRSIEQSVAASAAGELACS